MKKLIAILLFCAGVSASAHGPHGHYYGHHGGYNNWGWVAPAVIGGAIVYGMTRPPPPPQTVVVVPPGYPAPPPGYRYDQLLDANCNCYRWVLVQVY